MSSVVVHGRACRRTRLLAWFAEQLRRGGDCAAAQRASLEPCDLRAVWRDGALLCALVNSLAPGSCPEHPENNLATAQDAVSKQWALPPAFTNDELLQVTFSSHFERRLLRYLSAIQQASERLPGASDVPTLGSSDDARMSGTNASPSHSSAACVARGMGLFTATQYCKASFLLYLLDEDPGDVFVVIQTERDFGFARVGQHGCVLPSRYSNIPITISRDAENGTRVTFTPQSCGQHELLILRKGVHIPGSPFCIPVEKTTNFGCVDKEDLHTPVRRKRLRVLLRTVDFVTEKMILTDDGKLKKIPQSFLDEHLAATREGKSRRKPEIYIYVSEEGSTMHQVWGASPGCSDVDSEQEGDLNVTKNSPARKLTASPHISRLDGVGKEKCLQRQRNLDSSGMKGNEFQGNIRPARTTEFQSHCKKIISMCKFVLDKSRKSHGLSLLNAFHKVIDGRPIRMTDEIELILKQLAQSLPPPAFLELLEDPGNLKTTDNEKIPGREMDHRLSAMAPAGDDGNPSDVAVHTQIKCFEDKLTYCNNYIESVLQQNTVQPESPDLRSTTELKPLKSSNNPAVQTDFKMQPTNAELSPSLSPDPFNSHIKLDDLSAHPKLVNVLQADKLNVKTSITPFEDESGDLSPISGSNLAGFWPASSSSPSTMSEASNEGAPAIFPDLEAFLSCQFTKYMASETQFHLWPSDVAFGDVQDTICAMEDDEMIDFDSVISAPNLEDALVKLEQGLRMKSAPKRAIGLSSQDEAMPACLGVGGGRSSHFESVQKVVTDDVGNPSYHVYKTESAENECSQLNVCQANEYFEKDSHQNRSPNSFEIVVNPPEQEADLAEDPEPEEGEPEESEPEEDEHEEADDVASNPSPQAGHPSVEGWDSAYLSIDDLKGSPENLLSSNSVTSNHSAGTDSRDKKQACWLENANVAVAGFMGPAEKEIWGYDEEQEDVVDQLSGASFYPRVLTPLTKMMSFILEEDEEKIAAFSAVDEGEIAGNSSSEMQQNGTNLIGVRDLELQGNEPLNGIRITNDIENQDLEDRNGNPSKHLDGNVQPLFDHTSADSPKENTDNRFDSNFDGLLLSDFHSDIDSDSERNQALDDTLDEDVSVAFEALIAEQLDLFEQGSDFDSALAEALQGSALQETTSVDLSLQQGSSELLVPEEKTQLSVQEGSTEFLVEEESTEFLVQEESTEFPVQEHRDAINCIDWPVQSACTEMPALEACWEQTVRTDSTVINRPKEDKFITKNISRIHIGEGEKVLTEADDACLQIAELADNVEGVEKANVLTTVSPEISKIREGYSTKEYVTFKKDYWDRKLQMLNLFDKHPQPRSSETSHASSKISTHPTKEQPDGHTSPLSTLDNRPPTNTTNSEIDPKNCETLPRSPPLYRARRVLVSEDSEDLAPSECRDKTYSRRHQEVDKDLLKKNTASDLTQVGGTTDFEAERLVQGTRKDGEKRVPVEYSRRRPRQSSETDVIPRGSNKKASQSRKVTEDIGADSRQDDNIIDSCHSANVRRDSPEKMKERFQTAKQFFQSLEKNNGTLSRGLSSESNAGSRWKRMGAGWRGPLGGSDRVRVPRRCHIKDLF